MTRLGPIAFLLLAGHVLGQDESSNGSRPVDVAPSDRPVLLDRVVVLGASMSGGYALQPELRATVQLGDVLDCLLPEREVETIDLGDTYLFRDPRSRGADAMARALAEEPSLVVAVDFLFWFAYTSWSPGPSRVEDLEAGLALLDRYDGPLIVGDIPDMTPALEGISPFFGFPLLFPHMIPSNRVRSRLNARIAEWAAARGDVVVAPIAEMVDRMLAGDEIAVRGNVWPAGSIEALLQSDLLHPTAEGVIAMCIVTMDRFVTEREEVGEEWVTWDAKLIRERLLERTREERERWLERERAREERRRLWKEHRKGGDDDPDREAA